MRLGQATSATLSTQARSVGRAKAAQAAAHGGVEALEGVHLPDGRRQFAQRFERHRA